MIEEEKPTTNLPVLTLVARSSPSNNLLLHNQDFRLMRLGRKSWLQLVYKDLGVTESCPLSVR
jgi:hypothetical protein